MDNKTYANLLFNIMKKLNTLNNIDIDINDINIIDDDNKVIITLNKNGINTTSNININDEENNNLITLNKDGININDNNKNVISLNKDGIKTTSNININDEENNNLISLNKDGIKTNNLIVSNENKNIITINKDDVIINYNKPNIYHINFNDFNVFYSKCKLKIGETIKFSYKMHNTVESICYISGYQFINQKLTIFTSIQTELKYEYFENNWLFLHSLEFDNNNTFNFRYKITDLEKENQKYIGKWSCCQEGINSIEPQTHTFYEGSIYYLDNYNVDYDDPNYDANNYPYLFTLKGDPWSFPWQNKYFKFIFENVFINQQLNDNFIIIK